MPNKMNSWVVTDNIICMSSYYLLAGFVFRFHMLLIGRTATDGTSAVSVDSVTRIHLDSLTRGLDLQAWYL